MADDAGIRMGAANDGGRPDDERLLARAEEALTEIKVAQGLSEHHEAVLAALRIRLRGDAGANLDELLAAAEDLDVDGSGLDEAIGKASERSGPSLDDLLSAPPERKRSLDDLL